MLELLSLGKVEIRLNGTPIHRRVDERRSLLLIYLAEIGQPQSRQRLAQLLWPKAEPSLALTSLRTLITRMRNEGFSRYLLTERESVGLQKSADVHCDLLALRELLKTPEQASLTNLLAAAEIYQGPFFAGSPLQEFSELSEWVDSIQYELEMLMVRVYYQAIPLLLAQNKARIASYLGARLTGIASFDDHAHLLYLRSLAAEGRVAEAIRHINAYRRMMQEEFPGINLSSELNELANQLTQPDQAIRLLSPTAGETALPSTPTATTAAFPAAIHNAHALIGRSREQQQLFLLLENGHRLISLVGLGGAGKTFFLRSQLSKLNQRFPGGLHFADLRNTTKGQKDIPDDLLSIDLLSIVAAALQLIPEVGKSLYSQILAKLSAGNCCLILDNFETFQSTVATVLQLLEATPQLTIIITSRQRLNVSSEVLLPIGGLTVETTATGQETAAVGDAVTFFAHCAQRVQPHFAIDPANHAQVVTLCCQLGGLPLAIELAAMQLDFYSLQELITATASNSSQVLVADHHDLPGDHHSIEQVLSSMWQTLTTDARRVLTELSIFSNIWHRDAMLAVAPAPRIVYNELINTSLLQREESGWFSLHPLVKQFANARLSEKASVSRRYATHFLELLNLGETLLEFSRSQEPATFQQLQQRLSDLLQAWQWAVGNRAWELVASAIISLERLLILMGRYEDVITLLTALLKQLPAEPARTPLQQRLAGQAAIMLSHAQIQIGTIAQTERWIEHGIRWLEQAGTAYERVLAYNINGRIQLQLCENLEQAAQLLQKAVPLAEEHGLTTLHLQALLYWARCKLFEGKWAEVEEIAQKSVKLIYSSTEVKPVIFLEICVIYNEIGNWKQADALLDEFDTRTGDILKEQWEPHLLLFRCEILVAHYRIDEAITLLEQILPLCFKHTPSQVTFQLGVLALCRAMKGDLSAALDDAHAALRQAESVGIDYLTSYAKLFLTQVQILQQKGDVMLDQLYGLLRNAVASKDVKLVFSSLYFIVILRATELPRELYLRVVKIAASSPAMLLILQSLVHHYLQSQEIVIDPEESKALWATDLQTTLMLVAEVTERLGIKLRVE